jgi:hypothetical protein
MRMTSSCARTAPHRLPDPDPKSCSLSTNWPVVHFFIFLAVSKSR